MGDLLRGLEREDESFGRRFLPPGDVLLRRQVVERVVHLERREPGRVVGEEPRGFGPLGIEQRLPARVRPARRSDECPTASHGADRGPRTRSP